jgi:hypothetical protein
MEPHALDHGLWRNVAFFVAIVATALALGAALAHVYELPNKMDLSREDYFTVQQIYEGWNRLAYVLGVQVIGILWVLASHRRQPAIRWPVVVALCGFLAAQFVFWIWTFPANVATENWTQQPGNWEALRVQWEYSHLTGAVFQLLAMIGLIVALLRRHPSHRSE